MTYLHQSSARAAAPDSIVRDRFPRRDLAQVAPARCSDVREIGPAGTDDDEPASGDPGGSERAFLVGAALERLQAGAPRRLAVEHHTILLVVRGSEHVQLGETEYALNSGDVAFLPPESVGTERPEGSPPVDRLIVSYDAPGRAAESAFSTRDTAGRLREVGAWLVSERRATFDGAALYRECALGLLLAELARLRHDGCSVVERQTRAYVTENMRRSITLQELAANVGMSRHYFCRHYHRLTGESPMTTVRSLRLERARELVMDTQLSLREIAARVGFSSQYHLSRVLRSYFGVGMKELRASARRSSSV